MTDLYRACIDGLNQRDAAMRSRFENPTIDPETGERLRPLTQKERWDGLRCTDNSWSVGY